jgi:hypothetical protein
MRLGVSMTLVAVGLLADGAAQAQPAPEGAIIPGETPSATSNASSDSSLTENPADDLKELPVLLSVFSLQPPRHTYAEYQSSLIALLSRVNGLPMGPRYYQDQRSGTKAATILATGAWSTGELPREKATNLYSKIATFFLRPLSNDTRMKGSPEATGICSAVQGAMQRACRMHYCVGPGGNEPAMLTDALGQFSSACQPLTCSVYHCALNEERWTRLQTEFDSLYAAQAGIALASSFGAHSESESLQQSLGSWAGRLSDAENAAQAGNFTYIISGATEPATSARRSVAETLARYLDTTAAVALAAPVKNIVESAGELCSKAATSGTAMDFAQCSTNVTIAAPLIAASPASADLGELEDHRASAP